MWWILNEICALALHTRIHYISQSNVFMQFMLFLIQIKIQKCKNEQQIVFTDTFGFISFNLFCFYWRWGEMGIMVSVILPYFLQNCNPDTRHVTVGDLRQLMRSRQQQPAVEPPPAPAPEPQKVEVPVYKNPPLNPVSPGGGRTNWSSMLRKNVTFQQPNVGYYQNAQRNITAQNTDPFNFKW